jgi:GNAT superfamily N-acetyltransferase
MGELRLELCRADPRDLATVQRLLTEASEWLRANKRTDQWAEPWPSQEVRSQRIQRAIQAHRTWIAWDGVHAAASITASPNHHQIWPETKRDDPAVYVRRLVVSRRYSGHGLGAQLLDWAGIRATSEYGARWVRLDAWTTNTELHDYYVRHGFAFYALCEDSDYPSRALFEKPTDQIKCLDGPLFREVGDTV